MMMGHWRGSLMVGGVLDGSRVFVAGFRSGLSWVCGYETFRWIDDGCWQDEGLVLARVDLVAFLVLLEIGFGLL